VLYHFSGRTSSRFVVGKVSLRLRKNINVQITKASTNNGIQTPIAAFAEVDSPAPGAAIIEPEPKVLVGSPFISVVDEVALLVTWAANRLIILISVGCHNTGIPSQFTEDDASTTYSDSDLSRGILIGVGQIGADPYHTFVKVWSEYIAELHS
jgi:hypothetical protein